MESSEVSRQSSETLKASAALTSLLQSVWEVLSTPAARHATQYPDASPSSSSPFDSASPSAAATPSSSPPSATSPLPSTPGSIPSTATSPPATSTPSRKKATSVGAADGKEKEAKVPVSVMPVFGSKPLHEFKGHEADVLDLSWSKVSCRRLWARGGR